MLKFFNAKILEKAVYVAHNDRGLIICDNDELWI